MRGAEHRHQYRAVAGPAAAGRKRPIAAQRPPRPLRSGQAWPPAAFAIGIPRMAVESPAHQPLSSITGTRPKAFSARKSALCAPPRKSISISRCATSSRDGQDCAVRGANGRTGENLVERQGSDGHGDLAKRTGVHLEPAPHARTAAARIPTSAQHRASWQSARSAQRVDAEAMCRAPWPSGVFRIHHVHRQRRHFLVVAHHLQVKRRWPGRAPPGRTPPGSLPALQAMATAAWNEVTVNHDPAAGAAAGRPAGNAGCAPRSFHRRRDGAARQRGQGCRGRASVALQELGEGQRHTPHLPHRYRRRGTAGANSAPPHPRLRPAGSIRGPPVARAHRDLRDAAAGSPSSRHDVLAETRARCALA